MKTAKRFSAGLQDSSTSKSGQDQRSVLSFPWDLPRTHISNPAQKRLGYFLPAKKIAAENSAAIFRIKTGVWLGHPECFESRLINRAGWFDTLSGLIFSQSRTGLRSKDTIDFTLIISLLLQGGLDVGNDLAWIHLWIGGVDWAVEIIFRAGIISPRRIPVAGLPVVGRTKHNRDVIMMMAPPPLVMPLRVVILENNILRTFPFLSAGKFEVLIELHRLVFAVRFVAEIELLNFEVLVDVLIDVQVLVNGQVLVDVNVLI